MLNIFTELDNQIMDNKVLKEWYSQPEYDRVYTHELDYNEGIANIKIEDSFEYMNPDELEDALELAQTNLAYDCYDIYEFEQYIYNEFREKLSPELRLHLDNSEALQFEIVDLITIEFISNIDIFSWYEYNNLDSESLLDEFATYGYSTPEEVIEDYSINRIDNRFYHVDGYNLDTMSYKEAIQYLDNLPLNNTAIESLLNNDTIVLIHLDDTDNYLVGTYEPLIEDFKLTRAKFVAGQMIKNELYLSTKLTEDAYLRLDANGLATVVTTGQSIESIARQSVRTIDFNRYGYKDRLDRIISLIDSGYYRLMYADSKYILIELF